MRHNFYNLFLIQQGIKPTTKRVVHSFLADSYEKAKLYFHDYIKSEENKISYSLYKVAEIDKELKVREMKTYVCGGYEITWKPKYERNLLKEKEQIEKASKAKEIDEQLKILFEGRYVK